ncbi:MAG: hypothetical protein WD036_04640 [Bauldia sp.]
MVFTEPSAQAPRPTFVSAKKARAAAMRRLSVFNQVSLDGYIADVNGD